MPVSRGGARISDRDRRELREIASRIAAIRLGEPPSLREEGAHLMRLLGSVNFTSYSLATSGDRLELDVWDAVSFPADMRHRMNGVIARTPRWGHYDPLHPEAWQRNRALAYDDLRPRSPPASSAFQGLMDDIGIGQMDQLRILLCEHGGLLRWVGGFREKPFGAREKALLTALRPVLSRRFSLERHLRFGDVIESALAAALDAIPAEAYVVDSRATIQWANCVGRDAFARDRAGVREALLAGVKQRRRAASVDVGPYAMQSLEARGCPGWYLAVRRQPVREPRLLLGQARTRWGLTPRQSEVLCLLARGLSNQAIAIALDIAEGTAELHVSAILLRAGAESRAELIARFWSELAP